MSRACRRSGADQGREAAASLALSAARHGLAGLLLTAALALGLDRSLDLGEGYVAKALAAYTVVVLVLAQFLSLHLPHGRLGPANQVTLTRAVLVCLLAALLGEGASPALAWAALGLALVAEGLDGLDGHLARRWGWSSPFGARFDMEVDALLVAVLAMVLWSHGRAGAWVLAAGLLRFLFVAAGALWPWAARPLPPSRRRQTICVIQVLTLTLALAPIIPPDRGALLAATGLASLCYSFAVDGLWLVRRARLEPSAGAAP